MMEQSKDEPVGMVEEDVEEEEQYGDDFETVSSLKVAAATEDKENKLLQQEAEASKAKERVNWRDSSVPPTDVVDGEQRDKDATTAELTAKELKNSLVKQCMRILGVRVEELRPTEPKKNEEDELEEKRRARKETIRKNRINQLRRQVSMMQKRQEWRNQYASKTPKPGTLEIFTDTALGPVAGEERALRTTIKNAAEMLRWKKKEVMK